MPRSLAPSTTDYYAIPFLEWPKLAPPKDLESRTFRTLVQQWIDEGNHLAVYLPIDALDLKEVPKDKHRQLDILRPLVNRARERAAWPYHKQIVKPFMTFPDEIRNLFVTAGKGGRSTDCLLIGTYEGEVPALDSMQVKGW